jgi:hypothetical protein|nr:MAG TPA: hypothetical protein [Caudoviricetes sp.]
MQKNKIYTKEELQAIKVDTSSKEYRDIFSQIKNRSVSKYEKLIEIDVSDEYSDIYNSGVDEKKLTKKLVSIASQKLYNIVKNERLNSYRVVNGWALSNNEYKKVFFVLRLKGK